MKKKLDVIEKTMLSLLIILLTLTACGKEGGNTEVKPPVSDDSTVNEYDTLMYGVSSNMSPDPEKVKLEVPDYLCEEEAEYKITPLNQYVSENGESKAYRYEISSDQIKDEMNGFMEIHIPYDDTFFESGEDPAKCLSVHYVNEEGKLELELFDVDTENKEVIIYAQHLSPRELYHYKTQKLAEKYDINFGNLIVGNVSFDDSKEVFMGFSQDIEIDPKSWDSDYFEWKHQTIGDSYMLAAKLAANSYFPVLFKVLPKNDNSLIYDTSTWISNAANILSLGGPYAQNYINRGLTRLSTLGMYTSVCKLSYEFESDNHSKKTREDILNLYKTFMNTIMDYLSFNYSAWMAEKVAMYMSGVFVFSQLIDSMFAEAVYQRMWEMGEIYEYFNDSYMEGQYKPRSNKEWYDLFMGIIEKYCKAGKQDYIEDAIDHEIYLYAIRFWSLNQETADSVADAAGYKRRLWPTEDEQKKLTDAYIENLKYRLHPIVVACQKTMQKKTELATLNKMQETYNNFNFKTVLKVKDGNKKVIYNGYWFRFKGLSTDADKKIWQGQLDSKGQFTAKFSICDWIIAGMPTEVAMYKTEKDMSEEKNSVTSAKIDFGKKSSDESTVIFMESDDLIWVLDTIVYLDHWDNIDECSVEPDYSACQGLDVCAISTDCTVADVSADDTSIHFTSSIYPYDRQSDAERNTYTLPLPPAKLESGIADIEKWAKEISKEDYVYWSLNISDENDDASHLIYYSGGEKILNCGFEDNWPDISKDRSVLITDYFWSRRFAMLYRAMNAKEAASHNLRHVKMNSWDYYNSGEWK